jgi:hypothetical protein
VRQLDARQSLAALDWQSEVATPDTPAIRDVPPLKTPAQPRRPAIVTIFPLPDLPANAYPFGVPPPDQELPEFHPQTVLRDWNNGQAFRLADALTGVCVFGATGSGKTSGPAKHLAYGYLAADFGGLVLCAKKEERRQWQQWAADCNRTDDLVIVDSTGKWRFNFLDWEASRPDASGGLTINIVAILDEIAGAIASSAGKDETGGGANKFWEDALHHMNTNLVDLPVFAGLQVSLPLMRSIVNSAPQDLAQIADTKWQETSVCANILAEAEKATAKASIDVRSDFEECRNYWLQEYPVLSEKTRSIISLSFSMLVRPLITRPLRKLFPDRRTRQGRIAPLQNDHLQPKINYAKRKSGFFRHDVDGKNKLRPRILAVSGHHRHGVHPQKNRFSHDESDVANHLGDYHAPDSRNFQSRRRAVRFPHGDLRPGTARAWIFSTLATLAGIVQWRTLAHLQPRHFVS